MEAHYAGSIAYDNDQGEWEDQVVMAFTYADFIKDMKALMKRKRHSEVFFAVFRDKDLTEHDISQKVKEDIG
tara:strand:+ start:503 stop:718 length:216 start_codon:yes stop_codon:yes gene_type:complete